MAMVSITIAVSASLVFGVATRIQAQPTGSGGGAARSVTEIARLATPATATILAINVHGDTVAQGSGFFIQPSGESELVLVTNFHVLVGAARAVVVRSGTNQSVEIRYVLVADRGVDLVLLRAPMNGASQSLPIRTSLPEVGDRVVAIGTPLGLGQTVSEGIVSAHRTLGEREVVQITAPISPGSSGGAVLDDQGRVFAVSTANLEGGQQLNFAVPLRAGLSLLARAKAPRSLAAVFAHLQGSSTGAESGSSCTRLGMAVLQAGEALRHVRTAKVWAEGVERRRALAELEVQITALIESESVEMMRRAAWSQAEYTSQHEDALRWRRKQTDRIYTSYPTFAEEALAQTFAKEYSYTMEQVPKLLDPRTPPRCAAERWRVVHALAIRAAAL